MSGNKEGVRAEIRRRKPGCVYSWCVAPRLELAVLDAAKHDDYLTEFKDIISNIFLMYYLLPKLRQELGELHEITKELAGLK